jgi:HIRAN domain
VRIPEHLLCSWNYEHPSTFLVGDRLIWCKGTMSRQDAIKAALRKKQRLTRWFAYLIREPSNPHDSSAIAVFIGANHVGYLSADVAQAFAPRLEALTARADGAVPSCLCTIKKLDDGWIVGLIGPWPRDQSQDEFQRYRRLSDEDLDDSEID